MIFQESISVHGDMDEDSQNSIDRACNERLLYLVKSVMRERIEDN